MVASYKERRPWRWAKTLFFLVSMLLSLLIVCAPPLLVAVLDVLVPSALLSSTTAVTSQLSNYSFRTSLIDVPILSAARSLLILCVYVACEGRGPYLWITTACSFLSAGYVSAKAAGMYGRRRTVDVRGVAAAEEALLFVSLALAIAHIVVAYRTSCRERRKLIVYRIDIEAISFINALEGVFTNGDTSPIPLFGTSTSEQFSGLRQLLVSAYHNDFPSYHKIGLSK